MHLNFIPSVCGHHRQAINSWFQNHSLAAGKLMFACLPTENCQDAPIKCDDETPSNIGSDRRQIIAICSKLVSLLGWVARSGWLRTSNNTRFDPLSAISESRQVRPASLGSLHAWTRRCRAQTAHNSFLQTAVHSQRLSLHKRRENLNCNEPQRRVNN